MWKRTSSFDIESSVNHTALSYQDKTFQVSLLTRRNVLEELILIEQSSGKFIAGCLDLVTFLERIWPLDKMPSTDNRFPTAADDIWQHMVNNSDWDYYYLFNDYLNLFKGTDEQFLHFLEEVVHPIVRKPAEQEQFVLAINNHLMKDGFKLQVLEHISSYPIYRVARVGARIEQNVKNLIFAADGPKPEIVLVDSISNIIQITKNEEHCLIYDLPIPQTGLKWIDLVAWWANRIGHKSPTVETERNLYNRFNKSLSSAPERLFFRTYYQKLRSEFGDKLPALIPQVYLHYDPYTWRELKGTRRLPRQRMDFLVLFSNYERVVIEIDGIQHYSYNERASPTKYAEMVAADRKLRLAGYEVYRFGGYELQGDSGKEITNEFFYQLFQKHGIYKTTAV